MRSKRGSVRTPPFSFCRALDCFLQTLLPLRKLRFFYLRRALQPTTVASDGSKDVPVFAYTAQITFGGGSQGGKQKKSRIKPFFMPTYSCALTAADKSKTQR